MSGLGLPPVKYRENTGGQWCGIMAIHRKSAFAARANLTWDQGQIDFLTRAPIKHGASVVGPERII
jgi:hypothetical protein